MGEADLGEKVRYLALLFVCFFAVVGSSQATTRKPHAPAWFVQQALCVHHYEAGAWKWTPSYHPGYTYWNHYWTGMQFNLGTWQTANKYLHYHTSPYTDSPRLIILHAYAIVRHDGSWREWPKTARACGLNVS